YLFLDQKIDKLKFVGRLIDCFLLLGFDFRCRLMLRLQMLSEHAIPWWDNDRHGALGLCLASEADQRFWLGRINVTELFDLFALKFGHAFQFPPATENPHPTGTARS